MNPILYQMANSNSSVRIIIQKKSIGGFLLGISDGKNKPLICQGMPDVISEELQNRLPAYLVEVENAKIEAKLNGAIQSQLTPDTSSASENNDAFEEDAFTKESGEEESSAPGLPQPVNAATPETTVSAIGELPDFNEQPELDFGF